MSQDFCGPVAQLSLVYLLRGYYGPESGKNSHVKLISEVEPMPGQLVMIQPPTKINTEKPVFAISNQFGVLYPCKEKTFSPQSCPLHYDHRKINTLCITLLDKDVIALLVEQDEQHWQEKLIKAMAKYGEDTPDFSTEFILKEHKVYLHGLDKQGKARHEAVMRAPIHRTDNELVDQDYRQWHTREAQTNEYIYSHTRKVM